MSEPPACISVLDSADGALELVGAHSAAAGGAVAAAVQTSGFPAQPYASNAEATFVVTGPAVARFEPPFDLESYSEGCHDALRVLPDGEQLCGQVPPSDIAVAAGEALRVEFSSDDSVVRAGFRLSCMPLTTEEQGEVVDEAGGSDPCADSAAAVKAGEEGCPGSPPSSLAAPSSARQLNFCGVGAVLSVPEACHASRGKMFAKELVLPPMLTDLDSGGAEAFWRAFPRTDMVSAFGAPYNKTFSVTLDYGVSAASAGIPFAIAGVALAAVCLLWLWLTQCTCCFALCCWRCRRCQTCVRRGCDCCCGCCREASVPGGKRGRCAPSRTGAERPLVVRASLVLAVLCVGGVVAGIIVAALASNGSREANITVARSVETQMQRVVDDTACLVALADALPGDNYTSPLVAFALEAQNSTLETLRQVAADAAADASDLQAKAQDIVDAVYNVEGYRNTGWIIGISVAIGVAALLGALAILLHRRKLHLVVTAIVALAVAFVFCIVMLAVGAGVATGDACYDVAVLEQSLIATHYPEANVSRPEEVSAIESELPCPSEATAAELTQQADDLISNASEALNALLESPLLCADGGVAEAAGEEATRLCTASAVEPEDVEGPVACKLHAQRYTDLCEAIDGACDGVLNPADMRQALSDLTLLNAFRRIGLSLARCDPVLESARVALVEVCGGASSDLRVAFYALLGAGVALSGLMLCILLLQLVVSPRDSRTARGIIDEDVEPHVDIMPVAPSGGSVMIHPPASQFIVAPTAAGVSGATAAAEANRRRRNATLEMVRSVALTHEHLRDPAAPSPAVARRASAESPATAARRRAAAQRREFSGLSTSSTNSAGLLLPGEPSNASHDDYGWSGHDEDAAALPIAELIAPPPIGAAPEMDDAEVEARMRSFLRRARASGSHFDAATAPSPPVGGGVFDAEEGSLRGGDSDADSAAGEGGRGRPAGSGGKAHHHQRFGGGDGSSSGS